MPRRIHCLQSHTPHITELTLGRTLTGSHAALNGELSRVGWGGYPLPCLGTLSHSRKNVRARSRWPETSLRDALPGHGKAGFFQRTAFQNNSQRWQESVPVAQEPTGTRSPGGAHTHTVEDLQPVVAARHVDPALKDRDSGSAAIRAHRGHHCPPSGKSHSRRGAMRPGVPALPRQLRAVWALCCVPSRPGQISLPLNASPTACRRPSLVAASPSASDVRRVFSARLCRCSHRHAPAKASYRPAPPLYPGSSWDHQLPSYNTCKPSIFKASSPSCSSFLWSPSPR